MTDQTSPLARFDAALSGGRITDERGKDYGHPEDDFLRAAALRAELAACKDPALRHALDMVAVKMARLVQSPEHLDSWIDIAGYARCAVMILEKRAGGGFSEGKPGEVVTLEKFIEAYDARQRDFDEGKMSPELQKAYDNGYHVKTHIYGAPVRHVCANSEVYGWLTLEHQLVIREGAIDDFRRILNRAG